MNMNGRGCIEEKNIKEQDAQQYEGELTFWDHLEVLRWA